MRERGWVEGVGLMVVDWLGFGGWLMLRLVGV